MEGWDEARIGKARATGVYLNALQWREDRRDTELARSRFKSLTAEHQAIRCTWSGSKLNENNVVIDHCFPWSRWYNNDLWNLVPATPKVNGKKGDKLP